MEPYTASLLYRCKIRNAVNYIQFVTEANPITLNLWQGDYHVENIKQWAYSKIENVLKTAADLLPLFANDALLVESVQNAVQDSLEELATSGVGLPGNAKVRDVGIMRIEQ
jgi:hypothetical protein